MLLKAYTKEIFNNECMPSAMSVQCFAHLDEDVGEALPYLNAFLGGHSYIQDPPSVTFKVQGNMNDINFKSKFFADIRKPAEVFRIEE